MAHESAITLIARCHCGFVSYTYSLPISAFPLKSALCHCQSCRRATGQLFATFAVIPSGDRPDVSHLTEYATSSGLKRYFCPQCGASAVNQEEDEWEFPTGMLEETEALLNRVQLFVGDTADGGAANWLAATLPLMYSGHRTGEVLTVQQVQEIGGKKRNTAESVSKSLSARCHCGDVSFKIAAGEEAFPAGLDACTSCRKVTGFEITAWVTVPQNSVTMENGCPLNLVSAQLKKYSTSPGVFRYFCGRCGATIFYLRDGTDTIDIGAGLLQAQSGARAEEFLTWEKYDDCVAYQDDAIDPVLVQGLVRGIQQNRRLKV